MLARTGMLRGAKSTMKRAVGLRPAGGPKWCHGIVKATSTWLTPPLPSRFAGAIASHARFACVVRRLAHVGGVLRDLVATCLMVITMRPIVPRFSAAWLDTLSVLVARGRAQVSVAAAMADWPKRIQDMQHIDHEDYAADYQ